MSNATAIGEAAMKGELATVKQLVGEDPATLNSYDEHGWTPLHLAAHFGHREVAEALLAAGASVNTLSKNDLANLPLHAAAAGNQTALVELLLEKGSPVDATEHGGLTALHLAAENGQLEIVKLVLACGARPLIKSEEGKTAEEYARKNGHTEVADFIKEWADNRKMGIDLYNKVWTLLEKADRTPQEDTLMLNATHASAYFWSFVARPENLARSEWQISRVYAVLKRVEPALFHAGCCLAICQEHGIGDFDIAYAYEALARSYAVAGDKARRDENFRKATDLGEQIKDDEDKQQFFNDLSSVPEL